MSLTHKKSRVKYWFSAILLSLGMILGILPAQVNATPSGAGMEHFTAKNNGYYAGIFLRDCLNQTKQTRAITNPDGSVVSNGSDTAALRDYDAGAQWSAPGVDIGRYYAPDDGWIQEGCGKTNDVNIALGNFGYAKASDFFAAMGYTANGTVRITSGSPVNGTQTTTDYPLYVASSAQAVQDKINSRLTLTYSQLDQDKFFVYDTVFGTSGCQLNSTVTGSGTKATLTEVVEDPVGSGKFTTKSVDVEFPSKSDADKVITAYDYGGKGTPTNDTTCAKLLEESNKYASAMAKFNNAHPDKAIVRNVSASTTQNQGTNETKCAGGALGWLLCPIVTIMDNLNKSMAKSIESMLKVDMMTNDKSRPALQSIWQLLVGIANLLLVVAFLIVIFSQATSIGLSAYGIKKMLPRIIAAAILINLSFFICGILVDVFNIVGGTVKSIIDVGMQAVPDPAGATFSTSDPLVSFAAWITVLSGILVTLTAAALLGLIAFVLPVIATGTLATLAFFIGIALRQVLIVLLIVIAPIAIAAMILPNTEPLFKKWMSSFIKLLAMYPIVIAIMYGCALVAKIILAGT